MRVIFPLVVAIATGHFAGAFIVEALRAYFPEIMR